MTERFRQEWAAREELIAVSKTDIDCLLATAAVLDGRGLHERAQAARLQARWVANLVYREIHRN